MRDSEGTEGWVLHSLLSGRRTALVAPWKKNETFKIYAKPNESADLAATLQSGVIGNLRACDGAWCLIDGEGFKGYIKQSIFGASILATRSNRAGRFSLAWGAARRALGMSGFLSDDDFGRQARQLRVDTLIRLRWLAVAGQSAAVLITRFGLGFDLPMVVVLSVHRHVRRCSISAFGCVSRSASGSTTSGRPTSWASTFCSSRRCCF